MDDARSNDVKRLLSLTRNRNRELSMRIRIEHIVLARVKIELGYETSLDEKTREKHAKRASGIIMAATGKNKEESLADEDRSVLEKMRPLIDRYYELVDFHHFRILELEHKIVPIIKTLPIYEWIKADEQRGLGLMNVAIILGETGDLCLYDSPAKVWKRMGCAPYKGKMPSTHRGSKPALSAQEWEEVGYSPKRRSVMFVVADCLIKGNRIMEKGPDGKTFKGARVLWRGPYRERYDEAKISAAANHPDWNKARVHNHGNLLCGKRLLRELWRAWTGRGAPEEGCLATA